VQQAFEGEVGQLLVAVEQEVLQLQPASLQHKKREREMILAPQSNISLLSVHTSQVVSGTHLHSCQ
jgi:hypothetical protein